tara:strand:- start:527 stop:1669 length:1143 start_codon:yes stop_codon:yes gene_type:complete
MNNLALCMIVRDEEVNIIDCLESVVDSIDYWVICDTGSTDNTISLIKDFFKTHNISGELHEDEWVDFGHNRTLAFERARDKSEWVYVIDADDRLNGKISIPEKTPCNCFTLTIRHGDLEHSRQQLFKNDLEWEYVGVLHEYPNLKNHSLIKENLGGCFVQASASGYRSKSNDKKYENDINTLLEGIKKEPTNVRYCFYLAQSYKDNNDNMNAIIWYKKRSEMGGWYEEVFFSLYSVGICKERMGLDFEKEILHDYLKAFNYRKSRLEPLYRIINFYIGKNKFKEAFGYGMLAYKTPYPSDQLFLTKDVYAWQFNDVVSRAASWLGLWELSVDMIQTLIKERKYPDSVHSRMLSNLKLCKNQLIIDRNKRLENKNIQILFI